MDRFSYCLGILFGNEGGVSNDPDDRGGLTNMGVTQVTYNSWRQSKGLPIRPVTQGTVAEFTQLYEEMYWNTCGAPSLPAPLDLCVFDTSVNSGPARSVMILQEALGFNDANVDGRFGPMTGTAVQECDPVSLAGDYCDGREEYFKDIVRANPSQKKFYAGWINRLNHIRQLAGITNE